MISGCTAAGRVAAKSSESTAVPRIIMCALIRPSSSIPILVSTDADAEFSGRHVACTRCAPKRAKANSRTARPRLRRIASPLELRVHDKTEFRPPVRGGYFPHSYRTDDRSIGLRRDGQGERATFDERSFECRVRQECPGHRGGVRPPINISTDGRVGRVLMDGTFIRGSEISKNKAFRSQREHPAILERAQKHLLTRTHVRV